MALLTGLAAKLASPLVKYGAIALAGAALIGGAYLYGDQKRAAYEAEKAERLRLEQQVVALEYARRTLDASRVAAERTAAEARRDLEAASRIRPQIKIIEVPCANDLVPTDVLRALPADGPADPGGDPAGRAAARGLQ